VLKNLLLITLVLLALSLLTACTPLTRGSVFPRDSSPDLSSTATQTGAAGLTSTPLQGTIWLPHLTGPKSTQTPTITATGTSLPTLTATGTPHPTHTATETPYPTFTPTDTPSPTLSVRFAVIGDYGLAGKPAEDVSALVKSWEPDLILTTGDNNYPVGSAETIDENIGQYYHEYIFPYLGSYGSGAETNRFFPTLGNHDYGIPGALPYLEYFTLPGNERYYDFVWGPVHFFALNSDSNEPDGFHRDSIQAEWLRENLATSEAAWKIVYMHHPPFSSGTHGPITWMQWPFTDWGASAVLSGHDHTYERLHIDGLPYFVNGLGGGARYAFTSVHPGSQVRFRDDHGAMLVEADETRISFQFITRLGEVIDTHILVR
jgi:tartrate-resistant acid phosphatase type 5